MSEIRYEDLIEARRRIDPFIHRTPVMTSSWLDETTGLKVFLKCENFQRGGSFKIRGASHFLSRLSPEELSRGVVAHSSGNHAQAVALAARIFATHAHLVMPSGAPRVKREATQGYGAEVTICDPTLQARDAAAREIVERTGAILVHPYDHDFIIMGQSTAALELLEEVPDLDVIIAPVSGGGLLSGTALAAAGHSRPVRVVGAEPELADDACQSMRAGRLVDKPPGATIADGLRATLCERTFEIIRKRVDDVDLVSEEEIREALYLVWERVKIVCEPSAAVAFASVLFHGDRLSGSRVGVIVSGGNLDVRSWMDLGAGPSGSPGSPGTRT